MRIPRVFHQVWVGPDPLPDAFARYRQTWLDCHPDWELRFWTDENLPEGLRRRESYDRLRSPVERCDILRLELVWRFGGVYIDMDFECLRSIEPLIENVEFFTANIGEKGRVNHAILGAVPGNPVLERALVEIAPREWYGYDRESTGPYFFDRLLKKCVDPGVTVFDKELFYATDLLGAREYAYALHHDANSWKKTAAFRVDAERRVQRAKEEADFWRLKFEESQAEVARIRERLEVASD
jgi:mannosyltransferase OCH1-like enzyme